MSYHLALGLKITHGFWGDDAPPVRIVPRNPRTFAYLGLIAKPGHARLDVVAETVLLTDPVTLELDVVATDPELAVTTDGIDWATLPRVVLTDGTDDVTTNLTTHLAPKSPARQPGDPLFQIDVALPVTGQRNITLHCDAASALWAYHITGARKDGALHVVDSAKRVQFEDLGQTALPDGQSARVLRSTAPLPLRYRSPERFALEELQDPPFDPITLVPVLPVAGINLHPPHDAGAPHSLQSDIFVSLW